MNTQLKRKWINLAFFLPVVVCISCQNPFRAGLGNRIDLVPPVIHEINPPIGSFISGDSVVMSAHITDDIGVTEVYLSYWRSWENKPESPNVSMTLTENDIWVYTLVIYDDTTVYHEDGPILFEITAHDAENRSTASELEYTIKNNPPAITVNSPFLQRNFWDIVPYTSAGYDWSDFDELKPRVFSMGSIMGNVSDALGVRPRHPQIMFWDPRVEPNEPQDEARWWSMDEYTGVFLDGDAQWKTSDPDDPLLQRMRNIGFKFDLTERGPNGEQGAWLPADEDQPYFFRIRAWDTGVWAEDEDGNVISPGMSFFPPMDKPPAEMFIIGNNEPPPRLIIHPSLVFSNGDHTPDNEAVISNGITYNPPAPADKGYYLTGTADSYGMGGSGMRRVGAFLYEGSTLRAGPFEAFYNAPVGFTTPDPQDVWEWGLLIPAGELVDGTNYTVHVFAQSINWMQNVLIRDFTYDISLPEAAIVTPGHLERVIGYSIVRGTANDNNMVIKLEYRIGKNNLIWQDTGLSPGGIPSGSHGIYQFGGGLYAWNCTFTDTSTIANTIWADQIDPASYSPITNTFNPSTTSNVWRLPFMLRVTDIAGNQIVHDSFLVLDPDGDIPHAGIINPEPDQVVGGEIQVSGIASDNNWVYAVLVRTWRGAAGDDTNAADRTRILNYPVNSDDMRRTNEDGWALANLGNRGLSVNWNSIINQFGELNSPTGHQQVVTIEIIPIDSKLLETRSWTDDPPTRSEIAHFTAHPQENRVGNIIRRSFIVDSTLPAIENIRIEHEGSIVSFQHGLTTAGIFTVHADITGAGGINRAQWRSAGMTSGFENMLVNGNPVSGSSFFTIGMPAQINAGSFEAGRKYMISFPGDTDWTAIGAGSNAQIFVATGAGSGTGRAYAAEGTPIAYPYNLHDAWGQKFHYPLEITINSKSRFPVNGEGGSGSGNLIIDLLAEDFTNPNPYITQNSLTIQVDNFHPRSVYWAPRNASTAHYWVEGRARDTGENSGHIEGLREVLAYFRRNDVFYNPLGEPWPAAGQPGAAVIGRNVWDGFSPRPAGITEDFPDFPNYPNMSEPMSNHGGIPFFGAVRINANEIGSDTNGNGFIERFSIDGGEVHWGFQWDTFKFNDGPIELHYIVIDSAGNATHYQENLYIRNNPPHIAGITLRTDHTFSHTVGNIPSETGVYAPADRMEYQRTGFNARNNLLHFTVNTAIGSGNNDKTFRIIPVAHGPASASNLLVTGRVYTIETIGNTDWTLAGASSNTVGAVFRATGPVPLPVPPGGHVAGTAREIVNRPFDNAGDKQLIVPPGTNTATIAFGNRTNWDEPVSNDTDFGQSGSRIPDSTEDNGSLFLVTVVDSTIPGGNEAEQQMDMVLVGLNINNVDSDSPTALVHPFHWNGIHDNSLYQNSRSNGHIEYEADLPSVFTASAVHELMDRDPKVSGKISIRGTVTDNNIVGSLWARMDGFTFSGAGFSPGLNEETIHGQTYYRIAHYNVVGGLAGMESDSHWNTHGWRSSVRQISLDQHGHRLEWQLDIDTSRHTNVAALNVAFRIIARDISLNTQAQGSAAQTGNVQTNYYRMDIVPYISGIETTSRIQGGLKDINIRSADGRYSIIQGNNAAFITVRGFNLNPAAASGSVRILNTAQNNQYRTNPGSIPAGTSFAPAASVLAPYTSFTMTNNSAISGYLTVVVNSSGTMIGTLNNINNNDSLGTFTPVTGGNNPNASNGFNEENMPNREADRYITRNITLTNDRYLRFFTVRETDVRGGQFPVMIMRGNNPVFGYIDPNGGPYGNPKTGGSGTTGTPGTGAGSTVGGLTSSINPTGGNSGPHNQEALAQRGEFNYASGSTIYKEYLIKSMVSEHMAMDVDNAGRYGHYMVYNYSSGSTDYVYDRYAELWRNGAFGWSSGTTYTDWPHALSDGRFNSNNSNNTAMSFETPMTAGAAGSNVVPRLDRFLYPRLIIRGDSIADFAVNYLAYYDDGTTDRQIIFRTFQVGTEQTGTGRIYRLSYSGGGQYDNAGRPYESFTNYNTGTVLTGTQNYMIGNTGRNTAATGASRFFDMGVLQNGADAGRVVIVYFDESRARLRLNYSDTLINGDVTTDLTFSENTGITLPEYVGMYVSMYIDSADRIHLAAFNSLNSELHYIFIPAYNAGSIGTALVDQFGSVGNWTDIRLHPDKNVPYIAYYNAAEAGGREPIKLAFAQSPVTAVDQVSSGVDANGFTTGGWEYMTVPALQPPQGGTPAFRRVNLGFMELRDHNNNRIPMLGYMGTNIEFSYPVREQM